MRSGSSRVAAAAVSVLVSIAACVGDDPDSSPVTPSCDPAQKLCADKCVSTDDPNVGCGAAACTPCEPGINSLAASCSAGACASTCKAGFSDCDEAPGCEASISSDVRNCGACKKECGSANVDAPSKCEQGACVFTCKTGFGHCGTDGDQGCATNLLTTGEHCGACGHSCLGGGCVDGKCQPVTLVAAADADAIAVDATNVYVTRSAANTIVRVKKDGKDPQDFVVFDVASAATDTPVPIVSDGTAVFWGAKTVLGRRTAAGGPITSFGTASAMAPGFVVVAGGKIWWTTGSASDTIRVRKADLDGTNVTTIASIGNAAMAGTGGITADATHVYWAADVKGILRVPVGAASSCSMDGASPCQVVTTSNNGFGIVVDATHVYWTNPIGGKVQRAPKDGSGAPVDIATGQAAPNAIALLEGHVYWGNSSAGPSGNSIRRAPIAPAAPCVSDACEVVAQATSPRAIVADVESIYWVSKAAQGGAYRLAK